MLVRVVEGESPPTLRGEGSGWTTLDGRTEVYSPMRYKAAGGKCVYRKSTLRVEVGIEWIISNAGVLCKFGLK